MESRRLQERDEKEKNRNKHENEEETHSEGMRKASGETKKLIKVWKKRGEMIKVCGDLLVYFSSEFKLFISFIDIYCLVLCNIFFYST